MRKDDRIKEIIEFCESEEIPYTRRAEKLLEKIKNANALANETSKTPRNVNQQNQ